MEISAQEKKILLETARQSIRSFMEDKPPLLPEYDLYPNLKLFAGAFVTLTTGEKLRGCIGYIYSRNTLAETVSSAARQAAFSDPRFRPLTQEELDHITIEISVLSPPRQIQNYDEIKIGVHGLILDEPEHKALLLPQVASKNNLTLNQFLGALCEKAGLLHNYYTMKNLNIKVFTASVFSESDFKDGI